MPLPDPLPLPPPLWSTFSIPSEILLLIDTLFTTLSLLTVTLLLEFRKMKVDTQTLFFDKKGSPKVWCIKNPNGTLEFYNNPGLQPETGKTLKPISKYIIQEYVINKNK